MASGMRRSGASWPGATSAPHSQNSTTISSLPLSRSSITSNSLTRLGWSSARITSTSRRRSASGPAPGPDSAPAARPSRPVSRRLLATCLTCRGGGGGAVRHHHEQNVVRGPVLRGACGGVGCCMRAGKEGGERAGGHLSLVHHFDGVQPVVRHVQAELHLAEGALAQVVHHDVVVQKGGALQTKHNGKMRALAAGGRGGGARRGGGACQAARGRSPPARPRAACGCASR
jgi:hypothetical protein